MRRIALLSLLISAPSSAADLFVPSQYSLGEALNVANPFDRVLIDPGSYSDPVQVFTDDLTIEATASGVVFTNARKFDGDGVVFIGIDFVNSDPEVQPGQFPYGSSQDRPLVFDDCTFDGINSGNAVGGALDVRNGAWVIVANSTFSNNNATEGGAIGTWGSSRIEIYDSVFVGNNGNRGGVVFGRGTYDLVIERSVFSGNMSGGNGGVIDHDNGGTVEIRDSIFSGNVAQQAGGAVFLRNSDSVRVEGCTFEDNDASDEGGGLQIEQVVGARVHRTQFCNNGLNAGPMNGGGLRLQRADDAVITSNIFVGNRAQDCGGLCVDNARADVLNNTFLANESTGGGGGAAALNNGGDFRNNIAAHHTLGMALDGRTGLSVGYNLWFGNDADYRLGLDATNVLAQDPQFISWSNDGLCGDDLHLLWGSPAIAAGDPGILNPDGSRSDIGAFGGPDADPSDWTDVDNDRSPAQYDCDDNDPNNYPGGAEVCDGQDNDCDTLIDELDPDAVLTNVYPDADEDGFGENGAAPRAACFAGAFESDVLGDCNDQSGAIHPNAAEVCDGIDNNCDGTPDEGFADTDGDGIVDCLDSEECDGLDNDGNGNIDEGYPDTDGDNTADCVDAETCDGLDNDGDGQVDELWPDLDNNGAPDCPTTEICDGVDNDQNGSTDEGFPDTDGDGTADCVDSETCDGIDNDGDGSLDEGFADNDGDGIGNCVDIETCDGIDNNGNGSIDEGFPDNDTDGIANCQDVEECDGIDNDGDNRIDENFDNDNDGIANCFDTETCDFIDNDGDGGIDEGLDSDNDGLSDCDPAERETCDGLDNDGDGLIDDADGSLDTTTALEWYSDQDSDGFGDANGRVLTCLPPANYVGNNADCNPTDPLDFPGAVERCDGLDNDCDNSVDEGTVISTYWLDGDNDGFGDPDVSVNDCTPPTGYVDNGADCDDSTSTVSPDQSDFCGDGIDSDCDGVGADGTDEDGDGIRAELEQQYGADDCDADMDSDGVPDGTEWGLALEPRDSDGDGVYDIFDDDDDGDGISTFDEGTGDSDGSPIVACDGEAQGCTFMPDGIPNYLDLDSDGDCILDAVEGAFADQDDDGVVDFVDCNDADGCLGDGDNDGLTNCEEEVLGTNPTSADSDDDGVDDLTEVSVIQSPRDTDNDGVIDALDDDDDDDLVPTVEEVGLDTDSDQIPDYLDDDDDGDGVLTIDEDANGNFDPTDDDSNGDGTPDYLDPFEPDADADGIDDPTELALGTDPDLADSDGDGIDDGVEVGDVDAPTDSDGDGVIDALDDDDDDDGIGTVVEGGGDTDGDGTPDYLDDDSDGDGILDATETDDDQDMDGIPNFQDTDSDGDNLSDEIEGEGDDDGDGIPNYLDAGGGGIVEPPDPTETGCNCTTSGAPMSMWLGLPLLVGMRRRRSG